MKRLLTTMFFACLLAAGPAAAAQTVPPTDIATGAADPSATSAVVLGYFNYGNTMPPGIASECWFEYGPTLAYGSRETAICSGTTKATLAPLLPGTTYHYRAAAANEAGTSSGPDKTLTTLGSPPGGGTPPPAGSSRTTLRVVSGQSLQSVLRKSLRLEVTLSGPCPCEIHGKLLVPRAAAKRLGIKRSTPIALGQGELGAPGTTGLAMKVRSPVKRKLRHVRTLSATVRVTVTDASGHTGVASRSLRLKRGKR